MAAMDSYAGPNPYQTAGNPQIYAGSGYGGDPYASSAAGSPGAYGGGSYAGGGGAYPGPPPQDMMASGAPYQGVPAGGDTSFMKYRETSTGERIDPDNGIAPRRYTDCVCVPLFVLYVIGMIIVVWVASSRGDVDRLTKGFDYEARLCGKDVGVQDQPYLFWCRSSPIEHGTPTGLNLEEPTCVASCPHEKSTGAIKCLLRLQHRTSSGVAGVAGIEKSFFLYAEQTIAETNPYDTQLFGGRYCMPTDVGLRTSVMEGPVNILHRAVNAFGSFEHSNVWWVLFLAALIAMLLSAIYVVLMKYAAKYLLIGSLVVTGLVLVLSGIYFLWALLSLITPLEDLLSFDKYKAHNPFFTRNEPPIDWIASSVCGGVLIFLACIAFMTLCHVESTLIAIGDLNREAYDCVSSMWELAVPPFLEALWKFLLTMILMKSFVVLLTVGWIEDRRIVINNVPYQGASMKFYFDWYFVPWIVYYIYGAIWVLELCNAFGQFMVSYAVVSWYFMETTDGRKLEVPRLPPRYAAQHAIRYHLGSLCLGAAIIPICRIPRMIGYLICGNLPDKKDEGCCACCCRGISSVCCEPCKPCCMPTSGPIAAFNKNSYSDIIIRSNHFLPASHRAAAVIASHEAVKSNAGSLRIITVVGFLTIGLICARITYQMLEMDTLSNPASDAYVQDPMAVSFLAFCMCGNIAYSFMMVIDHTADTLLYCYAWNKKFNKATIDKYIPENLRNVVGHADKHDAYPFYGQATPAMYLGSWFAPSKAPAAPKPAAPQATQAPQQTAYMGGPLEQQMQGDPYGSYGGGYSGYGGAPETQPLTSNY